MCGWVGRGFTQPRCIHGDDAIMIKLLSAVITGFVPLLLAFGCGGTSRTASSKEKASAMSKTPSVAVHSSAVEEAQHGPKRDRDGDYERTSDPGHYYDFDDYEAPLYPEVANFRDRQAVATLVKRYITAAAEGDGSKACALMYSLYAETIPETFGRPALALRNGHVKTCAEVMAGIFRARHKLLRAEAESIEVTSVRLNGMRGLAVLRFRSIPARSIRVHRERRMWKVSTMLDTEVT